MSEQSLLTQRGMDQITRLALPRISQQPIETQIEIYHAISALHPSDAIRQSATTTCNQLRAAESSQLRFCELLAETEI